jgi:hypothetical protein
MKSKQSILARLRGIEGSALVRLYNRVAAIPQRGITPERAMRAFSALDAVDLQQADAILDRLVKS